MLGVGYGGYNSAIRSSLNRADNVARSSSSTVLPCRSQAMALSQDSESTGLQSSGS